MLRLGVDTGGTNTDAAVLSADNKVLGSAKRTTTEPDVLPGVVAALRAALEDADRGTPLPPMHPPLHLLRFCAV